MTKTKKTKRFFAIALAIVCVFTLCQSFSMKVLASGNTSGWGMIRTNTDVLNASGNKIGTIYKNEGVTVLSDAGGGKYYVEYSTSSGAKRGYITSGSFRYLVTNKASSATVNTSCKTYYAASTNLLAGSLSKGETVAVLCSNGVYDYVEYNTTKGRKRAYVEKKYLNYSSALDPLYQEDPQYSPHSNYTVPSNQVVYGGPSEQYTSIGSVNKGEVVTVIVNFRATGYRMYYIKYTASGHNKYGYIRVN